MRQKHERKVVLSDSETRPFVSSVVGNALKITVQVILSGYLYYLKLVWIKSKYYHQCGMHRGNYFFLTYLKEYLKH